MSIYSTFLNSFWRSKFIKSPEQNYATGRANFPKWQSKSTNVAAQWTEHFALSFWWICSVIFLLWHSGKFALSKNWAPVDAVPNWATLLNIISNFALSHISITNLSNSVDSKNNNIPKFQFHHFTNILRNDSAAASDVAVFMVFYWYLLS